jgi:hypothetical protein
MMTAARIHSKHQQTQDRACVENLPAGFGPHQHHACKAEWLAGLDRTAFFVEADGEQWANDHKPRKRREQDVVQT